jgi:hypothetical protein
VATGFVVAVGACHFDDSFQIDVSVDPGRPGAQFREACTEQAAASCAYQARCYAYYFERGWPDLAMCVERTMLACQLLASDPHANRDDASIRGCTLPADFPCSSDPTYETALAEFQQKCPETNGDLQIGTRCSTSAACASGVCRREYPTQLCGTCRPDPCAACAEGEVCEVWVDGTGLCRTLQQDEGPCTAHDDCASYYCKNGACAPRGNEGDPCDPGGPSCAVSVQAGLFCSHSTLHCERVQVLEAGASCEGGAPGAVACGGGTSCFPHDGTSTCAGPAADGTPCFATQGLGCLAPARCIDGFCRFQSPLTCSPD